MGQIGAIINYELLHGGFADLWPYLLMVAMVVLAALFYYKGMV